MTMRSKKIAPRYFYPWDAMQMSTDVDSGLRVNKTAVSFKIYRTKRRVALWSPLSHRHLALFSSTEDEYGIFLSNIAKESDKLAGSVTIELFDLDGSRAELCSTLDDNFNSVRYHPFPKPVSFFLDELIELLNKIRINADLLKQIEPPNKQLQIIGLFLSEENCMELSDPENGALLKDLLEGMFRERVYLFLFADDSSLLPVSLLQSFDSAIFLDENEHDLFSRVYPDVEVAEHSFGQLYLGCMFDKICTRLIPVHPLKYTLSEWRKERDKAFEEEDRLYREFLDSLEDGE